MTKDGTQRRCTYPPRRQFRRRFPVVDKRPKCRVWGTRRHKRNTPGSTRDRRKNTALAQKRLGRIKYRRNEKIGTANRTFALPADDPSRSSGAGTTIGKFAPPSITSGDRVNFRTRTIARNIIYIHIHVRMDRHTRDSQRSPDRSSSPSSSVSFVHYTRAAVTAAAAAAAAAAADRKRNYRRRTEHDGYAATGWPYATRITGPRVRWRVVCSGNFFPHARPPTKGWGGVTGAATAERQNNAICRPPLHAGMDRTDGWNSCLPCQFNIKDPSPTYRVKYDSLTCPTVGDR